MNDPKYVKKVVEFFDCRSAIIGLYLSQLRQCNHYPLSISEGIPAFLNAANLIRIRHDINIVCSAEGDLEQMHRAFLLLSYPYELVDMLDGYAMKLRNVAADFRITCHCHYSHHLYLLVQNCARRDGI